MSPCLAITNLGKETYLEPETMREGWRTGLQSGRRGTDAKDCEAIDERMAGASGQVGQRLLTGEDLGLSARGREKKRYCKESADGRRL